MVGQYLSNKKGTARSPRGFHFRTDSGASYYYDDCSGIVFPCPDGLKQALDNMRQSGRAPGPWQEFIRLRHQSYGAFFDTPPSPAPAVSITPDSHALKKTVEHAGFRQLILTVTDNCNLRCRYCINSEVYPEQTPARQGGMPFHVARKALDYYFANLRRIRCHDPCRPGVVTFYGGEPLLNFSLVKKAVAYTRNKTGNVLFTLSTNGLLLDDEKSDFLTANGFAIWISLDGPEKEHNRNRVGPSGRSSFKRLFNNIERFWARHPGYGRLGFLVTYDWHTSLEALSDFFSGREEFRRSLFVINPVKPYGTDYYDQFTRDDRRAFFSGAQKLKDRLRAAPRARQADPVLNFFIASPYRLHLMRKIIAPPGRPEIPATSTCMPGEKICVLPDGRFQPCERVPGLATIGTVNKGLDFQAIGELVTAYNRRITSGCGSCRIGRLCKACFAVFWSGREFRKPVPRFCRAQEAWVKEIVRETYSLLERDPEFYEEIMSFYQKKFSHLLSLHF